MHHVEDGSGEDHWKEHLHILQRWYILQENAIPHVLLLLAWRNLQDQEEPGKISFLPDRHLIMKLVLLDQRVSKYLFDKIIHSSDSVTLIGP